MDKYRVTLDKWMTVSAQMGPDLLRALQRSWFGRQKPSLEQEQELRSIFAQYPFGQTNFDTWHKQTLRQIQENAATK